MPRGDGTGPLGIGPLDRKAGGRGRCSGRRFSAYCPANKPFSGETIKVAALLMSMVSATVPAILKMQQVLAGKKADKLLENRDQKSKAITIEAESVEPVPDLKATVRN